MLVAERGPQEAKQYWCGGNEVADGPHQDERRRRFVECERIHNARVGQHHSERAARQALSKAEIKERNHPGDDAG